MPCDTVYAPKQTPQQRRTQIEEATARLEKALASKEAGVVIDKATGAVAFTGDWKDRAGVSDACAYRRLSVKSSFALRQAVATAETVAGRKVNAQAVAAGVHSHDGGKTWGKD